MRTKLIILVRSSRFGGGCAAPRGTQADRGVASVNVPVVTRADYVFDAAAPGGALAPGEAAAARRLVPRPRPWLRRHDLRRRRLCRPARAPRSRGSPATMACWSRPAPRSPPAWFQPGTVRVVVSRNRAAVPDCPNWSRPSQPDFENQSMSNFGCAVNTNLAAMVANPEDLIHGREGNRRRRYDHRRQGRQFYRIHSADRAARAFRTSTRRRATSNERSVPGTRRVCVTRSPPSSATTRPPTCCGRSRSSTAGRRRRSTRAACAMRFSRCRFRRARTSCSWTSANWPIRSTTSTRLPKCASRARS